MEKEWQDWKIYMRGVRGDISNTWEKQKPLANVFQPIWHQNYTHFALIDWYGSSKALYMFVTAIFDCFPLVKKKPFYC